MKIVADLHIHSPYSRAVSKKMTLETLAEKGIAKGIDLLGTGDFTHPVWIEEIKKRLIDNGTGVYSYEDMNFVLSNEIALIYTQGGKGRRIHYIILSPSIEVTEQINDFLKSKGRVDYDGRPIFGFSSIELVENLISISKDIEIIPAHAWTPWFGILGSMSGFNSLEECFQEKIKYIHAIETGLSSDPPMNWRCSFLDDITLISNSDSHSPYPHRLGREANVFDLKKVTYKNVIEAIRTKKGLTQTIETAPDYGKYHLDGHRLCNVSLEPKESKKNNNICPKCGKGLTIGVLNRVEELADRKEGYALKDAPGYKTLIPLPEIIALHVNQQVATKKVFDIYNTLMNRFKTDFDISLNVEKSELVKVVDERLADLIIRNRNGKINVIPGYDGVYGKPVIGEENDLKKFF
jgi:uncharacterized protein (TIGR00375 family)